MPFDGSEPAQAVLVMDKLIEFFSDEKRWFHDEYCKSRGQHFYSRGRMCLSGALEHFRAELHSTHDRTQLYLLQAIRAKSKLSTLEAFNGWTTHSVLLAVLRRARELAIDANARAIADDRSRCALRAMTPTSAFVTAETSLLADLIAFFERPESRHQERDNDLTLLEAMHHFRAVRRVRGDRTASYLRRAFRRTPFTFGSLKAFDKRASRDQLLAVLFRAHSLALADVENVASMVCSQQERLQAAA
jgi:hypothetical protein